MNNSRKTPSRKAVSSAITSPTAVTKKSNTSPLYKSAILADGDGDVDKINKLKKKKNKKKEKNRTGPRKRLVDVESYWNCLPDILLEDAFSRLSIRDRYNASQVCNNWYRIFCSPSVWSTFVFGDYTLTRRKYNYYMGYQHVLDHYRTQICLHRVGRAFRTIIIKPMENFFNLYEFLTIASYFCEYFDDQPLSMVRCLDFTFGCGMATNRASTTGEQRGVDSGVYGTGGKLLEALKRLMCNLTGLKHLSLRDLLLDKEEAMYLLDDVAYNCCETLCTLRLVNCTKDPYPIFHSVAFVNLQKLTISPQHISEDVVSCLGYTQLRDLVLLQTKHTDNVTPVPERAWKECRKLSSVLKVHLKIEGKLRTEIVWQEGAPVSSVIYDTPYSPVAFTPSLTCSNLYHKELKTYAHLRLPRFHMTRNFQDRADSSLLLIGRTCLGLTTIVIRELVSTCTVLLLSYECKNLQNLIVRRNALVKKFDWPHNPEWSDDFYCWLKTTSSSYELTTTEVSRILGRKWMPLTDQQFKTYRL